MNQVKALQEYFTPKAIQKLNYDLLITTAEERYGNLDLRSNNPRYPEFVISKMEPGDVANANGDDVSEAFIPVTLTIKGYKGMDFQIYLPVPGSKKKFEVNDAISSLLPASSIKTIQAFFQKVSAAAKVRLDFGYEDYSVCSDR